MSEPVLLAAGSKDQVHLHEVFELPEVVFQEGECAFFANVAVFCRAIGCIKGRYFEILD